MEIWKDIPGYEGLYQVSNIGRVRSLDRLISQKDPRGNYIRPFPGKIMNPTSDKKGYQYVSLSKSGKVKRNFVHSLVLKVFMGDKPPNYDCNHLNGIKYDNRLENLEYCTKGDNLRHSYNVLNRPKGGKIGEKHPKAKLTNYDISNIRKMYLSGRYTQKQLSKIFDVTQQSISNITSGIGWKHITSQ